MRRNSRPSGCPGYRKAAALSRRGFLKVGTLGALGLSLSEYLGLVEARGAGRARAKSVILLYAMGGISHHDSFDPKPGAPAEVRGEFRAIPTRLPGVRFSEYVPLLACRLDLFALVRSARHGERDHGVGAYYMLRGYPEPDPSFDRPENQNRANPTIGAQVARLVGSPNGLPPYVCVPGLSYLAAINYYTAGWMGRAYDPFVLKSDPNLPAFKVEGLSLAEEVSTARVARRASLLRAVDGRRRLFEAAPAPRSMRAHHERALQVLGTTRTRRAFDVGAEPDKVRDAYGRTRLGQSCLLARRLVEAGVPFVTVDDDGWDHHAQVFPGLKNRLPDLDRAVSALLTDLRDRGLLETTLVALLTDFGRTPVVNKSAGRDHWPNAFSVLFAGAGIRGGQVIGSSDRVGAEVSDRPVGPKDIAATLYSFLGLDPFQEYLTPERRSFQVLDRGEVIRELR